MKYAVFLLIVLLSGTSCKKKTITYTIAGTITDSSLSAPLNGALVQVYALTPGSTSSSTPVASATVGADGTYSFSVERDKVEKYVLKVTKSLYFEKSLEFTADALDPEATNTYDLSVSAKSWVKLHFVNPDGVEDIRYIKQAGMEGCAECCPTTEQWLYDTEDAYFYCINEGNTPYSIYYWVTGGNHAPMSVVTVPFDTTEIVVNY